MATLYALIAFGGFLAGFVTTLAGLGSVITLFILIEVVGLAPDVANGTNRIGILAMCLMAVPTFHKGGHLDLKRDGIIIIALFIGAMIGVLLVVQLDNTSFRTIFRYLLVVLLVVVLVNPKKRLQGHFEQGKIKGWMLPFLVLLGIYAGFIQVGTSVVLVVFLAMACQYSLVAANGIKLVAIGLYTVVCIGVFAYTGNIHWQLGIVLALGQAAGAYLAAQVAIGYPKINGMVRYLLIGMLCMAIAKTFEWYRWV